MLFCKVFCQLWTVCGGDLWGMVLHGLIVQADNGDIFYGVCGPACLLSGCHKPGIPAAVSQNGGISAALAEGYGFAQEKKALAVRLCKERLCNEMVHCKM